MITSKQFECPICGFGCGRNKKFEEHLGTHGFESLEKAYIALVHHDQQPSCQCECGQHTKFMGWNHGYASYIKGHNGKLSVLDPDEAREIVAKRNKTKIENGYTSSWSKGLTKNSNKTLRQAGEKRSSTMRRRYVNGEIETWAKGLTKETDDRLAKYSMKMKKAFADGECIPWAKGRSKETDERVAAMALNVKRSMNDKSRRKRLDDLKRLSSEEVIKRLANGASLFELISDISDYTRDRHTNMEFKCRNCGLIQVKSLLSALSNKCDSCTPPTSAGHAALARWLDTVADDVQNCDRKIIAPYELDIVLPEHRIAVEYNGLYFHSSEFKDKSYHSMKTTMAKDAGYRLIHVFEDEWLQRPDIVKSSLLHAIKKSSRTLFARKCSLSSVSSAQKRSFFEDNHMDGDARSSVAWGLFCDDEIVACLSLRRPMHKKHAGSLELCRFATLNDTSVPGGLSRLVAMAKKHCHEIGCQRLITYVDTRFGDGNGYRQVGFTDIATTINRFWWTDGRNRIDRFKIRADKEAGLTEQQVAAQHGVIKIWGCPNFVLEMNV